MPKIIGHQKPAKFFDMTELENKRNAYRPCRSYHQISENLLAHRGDISIS